jgi:hypothetical protein
MEEVKQEEAELNADRQKFLQETKRLKLEKEALEAQVVELRKYEDLA